MKKLLPLILSTLLLSACTTNEVKFTINGTMTGAKDSTMIVLSDFWNPSQNDTLYTINQKFTFVKTIEKPSIMWLNKNYFVAENGTINVILGEQTQLSGTPLNDTLQKLNLAHKQSATELNELVTKLNAIDVRNNPKRDDSVLKVINDYYNEVHVPIMTKINREALRHNRKNPIGPMLFEQLLFFDTIPDIEQIEEYFVEYPEAKENFALAQTYKRLKNQQATKIGSHFKDFTVRNIENTKDVKLSDYVGRGDYILVDFWASWCGPCIAAIPQLKEAQEKFGDKNFNILGVNVSDKHQNALKSIEEKDLKWPQLFDNGQSANGPGVAYAISGIPTLILFSPDGKIMHRTHDAQEMLEIIEQNIK